MGSLVGGYRYDRFGSYTVAFHSAAVMAFVVTTLVLAFRERPMPAYPPAPTPGRAGSAATA